MADETFVLERVTHMLNVHKGTIDLVNLARRIVQTIQPGDDIGNRLRVVPISALEDLRRFLEQPLSVSSDTTTTFRPTMVSQRWPRASCAVSVGANAATRNANGRLQRPVSTDR